MKTWKVPVTWKEIGVIEVRANTLDKAIEIARDEDETIPIPDNGSYAEGTWDVYSDDTEHVRIYYNEGQEDIKGGGEMYKEELEAALNKEIEKFRKSIMEMNEYDAYEQWYRIGFYEEYYDMLKYEICDCLRNEEILTWLCEFENPLQFLYNSHLSCDDAFNHDWEEMLKWIEGLYEGWVK